MGIKGKAWYPKAIRDLVDYDYEHKLTDKDRAWLAKFSDEVYGAYFKGEPLHADEEKRRELGRDKNRAREDLFGRGLRRGREVGETDAAVSNSAEGEATPHPAYLGTPAYREALAEYRSAIPEDQRQTVLPGPRFKGAEGRLIEVTHALTSQDRGKTLARNRLKRLQESREVLYWLGAVVSDHAFPGRDAAAPAKALGWLTAQIGRLDKKLGSAGIKPPPGQELNPGPAAPGVKGRTGGKDE